MNSKMDRNTFLHRVFDDYRKIFLGLFLVMMLFTTANAQFYQGTQMTFGKNRVQYNEFFWSFYRFQNFDSYYYKGGTEIAMYVGKVADEDLAQIQKLFDYNLDGRLQFIIFNRLSDLKQSNIGLDGDEQYNIGGTTRIMGSKILLYFDGDHRHLRSQIREGIAQVLFNQLMFGGDIKDVLQNAALLNIPIWYSQGLISYVGCDWNTEIDNRMRDGILSGRYKKFNRLQGADATYAGHSIWKYIADIYGEGAISNLLFMTRMNRNIESGMNFVLGTSLRSLTDSWMDYYQKKYFNSDKGKELPTVKPVSIKNKTLRIFNQLHINPDGTYAAYVMNDIGKYKVYLKNLQTGSKKKLMKGGYKSFAQINDESMPVLCWHPTGKLLAMIREYQGKVMLRVYDVEKKKYEESQMMGFDKITDMGYSDDGQNLVLSGIQKGQSDIYVYNIRSHTFQQITNDIYDDFYPRFVNHSSQIAFSSDRINDTLREDRSIPSIPFNATTDIYLYDYKTKSKVLKRLTNTPMINEIQPFQYDSSNIAYLSDQNGIYNRYIAHMDSVISYIDTTEHYRDVVNTFAITNFPRNIISQDINARTKRMGEVIYMDGKYKFFSEPLVIADSSVKNLQNTIYRRSLIESKDSVTSDDILKPGPVVNKPNSFDSRLPLDSNKIDINNYTFQTESAKPKVNKKKEEKKKEIIKAKQLNDSLAKKTPSELLAIFKARNYDLGFSTNYIVTQLDNSMLTPTYQPFNPSTPVFFDPGLLGSFKVGLTDLMEDYRIVGGVRLSGDFSNNQYFLSYENLKNRMDKKLSFYRVGETYQYYDYTARVHTHELQYSLKWPFNDIASIKGSISYRNNRNVLQASDLQSLQAGNYYEHWGILQAEYVFDNTINTGLNLYNGTRYKVFAQMYHQDSAMAQIFGQQGASNATMYVVGIDFRHYIKIHREIIWANRFAASTSFGQQKLIYYLGGVDNWLFPKFDQSTNIDTKQNYAYQALATNLRGFQQNVRNGNSFAVINSELRVPLFQYLINRPIKSDFIKNFQIIGFTDIGTAWNGKTPFDSTTSINKTYINNGPALTVILETQRQPIVAGYGFGLRSRMFGYFVRADWAWGYQDGVVQKSIFYLSLSLDF
ncbi:MAG: hypothetical protein WCL14_01690 [Bacteroidota bacterium]